MVARSRLLLAAALAAAVLGAAGCDRAAPAPASPAPASATTPSAFAPRDLTWIQIMLAMNEQILPLVELVPERSGDPDVQALALQVQAFTNAELQTLRALHDRAGLPADNPYRNMPLPGMVTAEQVADAAKLAGKRFDVVAVKEIRAHLEQGRRLARDEDDSGVEPETHTLALEIVRTRDAALSTGG